MYQITYSDNLKAIGLNLNSEREALQKLGKIKI